MTRTDCNVVVLCTTEFGAIALGTADCGVVVLCTAALCITTLGTVAVESS